MNHMKNRSYNLAQMYNMANRTPSNDLDHYKSLSKEELIRAVSSYKANCTYYRKKVVSLKVEVNFLTRSLKLYKDRVHHLQTKHGIRSWRYAASKTGKRGLSWGKKR